MIHSQKINRRTALYGMGALITLPYLESTAAQNKKGEPSRLGCFYIPGGIGSHGWFPKDTGFEYTMPSSHKPLENFRNKYTVLTRLMHIQGRVSGHYHPYSWLTGHNVNMIPGMISNTVSMDQVAAKYMGPTYLPSLVLSWRDGVGDATLSRNFLGVDVPALADYQTIFKRLFPPADKKQIKEARERIALDKSVLDTALDSVNDLNRKVGKADKERVEQYLDSIRDVEKRLTDKDEIVKKGRPEFDEKSLRLVPQGKKSMEEHIEILMDLTAIAFQTDMTRVVTHALGGEGGPNYDEYHIWAKEHGAQPRGAHDTYHKGSGGKNGSPDAKVMQSRDTLLCAQLARLMKKLEDIKVSNGSLLDNTVLLLGGAQVHSHSSSNFPTILAGGSKLGFKHGQHLKFGSAQVPMSSLYLTILQQLGCPVDSFKESRKTISEILI